LIEELMLKELENIINEILLNKNKKKLEKLLPTMSLRNEIGLDSLDLAELTVKIESIYDIDIFEDGIVENIQEILDKLDND